MKTRDLKSYCPTTKRGTRKGRSESRIQSRDEKLAHRFYYHAEVCGHKYNAVLAMLSSEFDIDETVVTARLKMIAPVLDKVFNEKPGVRILRKKYPYYSW
jgi:hypothetical protein